MRTFARDLRESRLAAWTELHRRVETDLKTGRGDIRRGVVKYAAADPSVRVHPLAEKLLLWKKRA